MALNIPALIGAAFAIGKATAPDAFPRVRILLGPTTVPDPVAETAVTIWNVEIANVEPIAYADKNERDRSKPETSQRTFAVPTSIFPSRAVFDQKGEIHQGETVWMVYKVETDPTGSLVLMHATK